MLRNWRIEGALLKVMEGCGQERHLYNVYKTAAFCLEAPARGTFCLTSDSWPTKRTFQALKSPKNDQKMDKIRQNFGFHLPFLARRNKRIFQIMTKFLEMENLQRDFREMTRLIFDSFSHFVIDLSILTCARIR